MIPTTRVVIDEENPWPGLAAFDESAERFFNGRADESAALRRLVGQAPLTVLFGASGLGKSSLLQAGLFPLLRRDHYLPIYIRLDVRDGSGPLIEQVKRALEAQVKAGPAPAVITTSPLPLPRPDPRQGAAPGIRPGFFGAAETRVGILQYRPHDDPVGRSLDWYGEFLQPHEVLRGIE